MNITLYKHQEIILQRLPSHKRYAIFAEMGLGKTAAFLMFLKQTGLSALVICPLAIVRQAWLKDNEKFGFNLPSCNLHEVLSKRREIPQDRQLYVINIDRVAKAINKLPKTDVLIIDESSQIKSPKTKRTKAIMKLSQNYEHCYLSSGSPAPNSPMEYWPQMYCIDPQILGRNFYAFRNTYFYRPQPDKHSWLWVPYKGAVREIMSKVETKAVFLKKEDWLDLPEKQFLIREVIMNRDWAKAYEEMRRHQVLEIGDVRSIAPHQFTKILRLREITSGFIRDDNNVHWISQGKLKALDDLLSEISGQVVIWTNWTEELRVICDKYNAPGIYGNQNAEERNRVINEFIAGKHRILAANIGTISHGITLTNCHDVIYFSLTYSYEQFAQSQDRFHRIGQRHPVNYHLLICPNTIDEVLGAALQRKENIMALGLDMLRVSPKNL